MKIAILGSGNIGATIGRNWALAGHDIVFGVRDVQAPKVGDLLASIEGSASADGLEGAVEAGDAVLFAIPGRVMSGAASDLGPKLAGKILIDATNQIGSPVMNALADLRAHAPEARLFRAFNYLGWENFAEPVINGVQVDLCYCGDSGEAQTIVDDLIRDVGLNPIYIGGAEKAKTLDAMLELWFTLVRDLGMGRHTAFKIIRE